MCITICTCGALCCLCTVLASLALLFSALLVPAIENVAVVTVHTHLSGLPFFLANLLLTGRHFAYCMGDYVVCVKDQVSSDMQQIYGYEAGVGMMVPPASRDPVPIFFSHEAYAAIAHSSKASRPPDMFVMANKTALPPGALPDLEPDILLNFNTGTKEHSARRQLLADALPALAQKQTIEPVFSVPDGVKASDAAVFGQSFAGLRYLSLKRAVFDTVALNLFNWLYGIDVQDLLSEHFEYDTLLAPSALGIPVLATAGQKMASIRKKFFDRVVASQVGKGFIAEAEKRGMDGMKRIDEMVWITMFAGYGGTSNLAMETVKFILKDPAKHVKLFKKDKHAFILESARLHPPVGGMNPISFENATSFTFRTARTLKVEPGSIGMLWISGANKDPKVFKDDAKAFKPGRLNAERLLSWNNEWGLFSSCETVAGCPAAPRGCPGTFLSARIVTAVVNFFVEGIEEALKAEGNTDL
jgi:hypothetical protein